MEHDMFNQSVLTRNVWITIGIIVAFVICFIYRLIWLALVLSGLIIGLLGGFIASVTMETNNLHMCRASAKILGYNWNNFEEGKKSVFRYIYHLKLTDLEGKEHLVEYKCRFPLLGKVGKIRQVWYNSYDLEHGNECISIYYSLGVWIFRIISAIGWLMFTCGVALLVFLILVK